MNDKKKGREEAEKHVRIKRMREMIGGMNEDNRYTVKKVDGKLRQPDRM
jgi:hypothetical protein